MGRPSASVRSNTRVDRLNTDTTYLHHTDEHGGVNAGALCLMQTLPGGTFNLTVLVASHAPVHGHMMHALIADGRSALRDASTSGVSLEGMLQVFTPRWHRYCSTIPVL